LTSQQRHYGTLETWQTIAEFVSCVSSELSNGGAMGNTIAIHSRVAQVPGEASYPAQRGCPMYDGRTRTLAPVPPANTFARAGVEGLIWRFRGRVL